MDTVGIFGLSTPKDLLDKLRHDFNVLKNHETAYAAFNFFVTAEHLVDWLHPQDRTEREALRGDPLLALVSHLANGAKHFGPLNKRHVSAKNTKMLGGYFNTSYFPQRYFGRYFGAGRRLGVTLDGTAAAVFGQSMAAVDLAEKVLAYWEQPGRIIT